VGKGDRRTRRGKIYAGSFGKSRPKDPQRGVTKARPAAAAPAARPATRAPAKTARKAKS
jgi:30S ribosomal protein S31